MKIEKGKCPNCGKDLTGNYENQPVFTGDGQFYFIYNCGYCGNTGKEFYESNFIGFDEDKEDEMDDFWLE